MSKSLDSRFKSKAWGDKKRKPKQRHPRRKTKLEAHSESPRSHRQATYFELPRNPYLHTYMDNGSWMYLEPAAPLTVAASPYALPPSCRRHYHQRGYRQRHEVAASWCSSVSAEAACCAVLGLPEDELREVAAGTSTFRKVPWHPNLHMLKMRRA